MAHERSGHRMGQRRFRRVAVAMLAFCCLGAGVTAARAVDPPQPDFFWPYGQAQLDGANLEPEVQPVIAIVNGRACGEAETRVVEAGEGVPPADVGKTVYVVDVLADGSNEGQRVGCGRPGDAVTLYFPASHRFATGQLQFVVGSLRADVELGAALANRLPLPMLAGDSAE